MKINFAGSGLRSLLLASAVCMAATPAAAQLGGLGHALGEVVSPLSPVLQAPDRLIQPLDQAQGPEGLLSRRIDRLDALVRAHPRQLDEDERGAPVVRGQVLAIAPSAEALDKARRLGFSVRPAGAQSEDDLIGLFVLDAPPGMGAREAVRRLRGLDPAGTYDFNHLYEPSGVAGVATPAPASPQTSLAPDARIGLIDTGVETTDPVFGGARIEQRAFAGERLAPAPHGTAVASLMVGQAAPFVGAAPGARLFVADVYGDQPTGGAADTLIRALFWLAARKTSVINISLVGPPNAALAAAIVAVRARGVVIVAAVGNDGPAAPPAYPASYPGVIAVTGVDGRGRVLIEAGRAAHLDFAAPGADMAAAAKGGGFVSVRGTSFAAPIVAGRLASLLAASPLSAEAAETLLARDGSHSPAYGRGLIGMGLRTPPAAVHAARPLS